MWRRCRADVRERVQRDRGRLGRLAPRSAGARRSCPRSTPPRAPSSVTIIRAHPSMATSRRSARATTQTSMFSSGDPAPRREARKDIAPTLSSHPSGGGGLGPDFELGGRLIAGCLNGHGEYGADLPTLRAKGGDAAGGSEALLAFGGNNTSGPVDVAAALQAHAGPAGRQDFATETFVAHALRAEGFDASEDGTGRARLSCRSLSTRVRILTSRGTGPAPLARRRPKPRPSRLP